ncbi:UDP-N-acetylglucosamine 2-epimerase (non-hydrolyzing) [Alphaproteobacteria bacterium]|nr:UDP-N-acetylglucosamine 2-epimerase (non-hydrolyzing) [Alphaproteobacteria bacterium]
MFVFGTRPEAIKMGPIVQRLKYESKVFEVQVCVTAQHREMLDQVLKVFEITPDIDLHIMKPDQDLSDVTINVLQGMKDVFKYNKPDVLLIHGDTTTTLAAAIAGFYAGIPIGHIEAGLRTHDLDAPFPEEFNRQITSKITKWHFAPTKVSRSNLISENVNPKDITVTGNTVIDALYWTLRRIESNDERLNSLKQYLDETLSFNWLQDRFILITGHRRENFGNGFQQICQAIHDLALKFNNVQFIYPVHFNPNVQRPVREILSNLSNVHLIDPLDYEPFIYLLKHSYLVLTDSGGIQEEAPSLGKPVLVMRDVTERPEAVIAGTVELVGAKKEEIVNGVSRLFEDKAHYLKMSSAHNPYGDGKACDRIVKVLKNI